MPVSVATSRDPFRGVAPSPASPTPATPAGLRPHQARLLRVLVPACPDDPPGEWPLYTRAVLGMRAGYSPTNSLNRLLNHPRDGLIQGGFVEIVLVDIEGTVERNYRITAKGIHCLSHQNGADHS